MNFKNLSWGKGAADQTDLLLFFLGVQNVFYEKAAIHFSYTYSRYIYFYISIIYQKLSQT